jgi:predicted nucleic acid-binding protein
MIYVFDASFIGALIIPDEHREDTYKLFSKIQDDDQKYVPQLLWYEIGSLFKNLIRRKRYTCDEVLSFVPLLAAIRLTSDSETGVVYTEKLFRITQNYDISAYDAAYLELAGRKKAVLCTLDENLETVAKKHGVAVLK